MLAGALTGVRLNPDASSGPSSALDDDSGSVAVRVVRVPTGVRSSLEANTFSRCTWFDVSIGGKVRVNLEIVGEMSEPEDAGGEGVRFSDGVWSCCRKIAFCIGTVDFCITDARLLGDSRNTTVSTGDADIGTDDEGAS